MDDLKDQVQEDQGTTAETEIFTFEGKEAQIKMSDGKIEVALPEGLSDEAKTKFKESIKAGSKLIASLNKKHYELNRQRENEPDYKAKVEQLESKLKALEESVSNGGKSKPNDSLPLWKELGLDSESDLKQFAIEYPDAYLAKLNERSEQSLLEKTQKNIAQQTLEAQIKSSGLNYDEVKRFAQYYGMPLSDKALELYQKHHSGKRDPVTDAQIAAQQHQIVFIEQGKRGRTIASKQDLARLSDQELDEVINEFKKG